MSFLLTSPDCQDAQSLLRINDLLEEAASFFPATQTHEIIKQKSVLIAILFDQ